jgi:hypothetical protein
MQTLCNHNHANITMLTLCQEIIIPDIAVSKLPQIIRPITPNSTQTVFTNVPDDL